MNVHSMAVAHKGYHLCTSKEMCQCFAVPIHVVDPVHQHVTLCPQLNSGLLFYTCVINSSERLLIFEIKSYINTHLPSVHRHKLPPQIHRLWIAHCQDNSTNDDTLTMIWTLKTFKPTERSALHISRSDSSKYFSRCGSFCQSKSTRLEVGVCVSTIERRLYQSKHRYLPYDAKHC